MATFKNRALTIATVGLLSGSPLTIATQGLIQPAVVEPVVPVTAPDTRVHGSIPTHVDYKPLKRIVEEIRYGLKITDKHYYYPVTLNEYKNVSHFFYDVIGSQTVREPLYAKNYSELIYGLNISHISVDKASERHIAEFKYGLNISGIVTETPVQHYFDESQADSGLQITDKVRYLPAIPEQIVYSNIQTIELTTELNDQVRYFPSDLNSYSHKDDLVLAVELSDRFEFITPELVKYSNADKLSYQLMFETYSFHEKAPITFYDEDEEILYMLAQILLEDED